MSTCYHSPFTLYYASPEPVEPPYQMEARLSCSGWDHAPLHWKFQLRYLDREDFSKADLQAAGLSLASEWSWEGSLPKVWTQRISRSLEAWKPGNPRSNAQDPELFVESQGQVWVPKDPGTEEETWVQALFQGIMELADKEEPLYLAFQFLDTQGKYKRIQGHLSFAALQFSFEDMQGGEGLCSDWEGLQTLMLDFYQGDFNPELAREELKQNRGLAVFPGDGWWYVAGEGLRQPHGNKSFFSKLETSLQKLFP